MLPKAYSPKEVEDRIYQMWEDGGAFKPGGDESKQPFCIAMPPPNATGNLHLGHAVMLALEDIFIRFARMRGKEALWVPGTDHAAIATENVVMRLLKEQGTKDPRKELGREGLVAKIAEYVEKSRGTIRSQMRKMGSSCDWSRERYTMDPQLNRCVNEVFKRMYDDGLIYRGHRIVNWDSKLQTTVSDDEVDWKEESASFYTFQYGPFRIGTARPETKFGDKYVVVHPDDERYREYADGQTFACEWINGPIRATVIKDKAVDPAFGTGCMTITPWHDAADFDIAERHGLEKEQIIGFDGRLLPIAGEFAGQTIEEARPKIVEKLQKKGLLVQTDPAYVHRKAVSQRGGGVIEPQIRLQWFIDVNKPVIKWNAELGRADSGMPDMSLRAVMQSVVHHGNIKIIPERFAKTYFHWVDNLRDWCISRQIWWGHQVPVWYCGSCESGYAQRVEPGNSVPDIYESIREHAKQAIDTQSGAFRGINVSVRQPATCKDCGRSFLFQDEDTLDTWFSSALWTWSTLVDPKVAEDPSLTLEQILERSPDYRRFHPTTVMETGYDILFFWVARMILMTTYATGHIPFRTVYLHGLVRTRDGKKMSKSDPKTMIDPLDMIAKYGVDALRLSMIVGQAPGADAKLYEEKIAGYRNFVNKLWNASRFILMECEKAGVEVSGVRCQVSGVELSLIDRAVLHALQVLICDVTEGLEKYRLSEVGERLYSFVWDYFCDWYLELSKGSANTAVLLHVLRTTLRLLHPYCPFVTEELWGTFKPAGVGLLIQEQWPESDDAMRDPEAEQQLSVIIEVVTAIRRIRADYGIDAGKEIDVTILSKKLQSVLVEQQASIECLGHCHVRMASSGNSVAKKNVASAILKDIAIHVSLEGAIDHVKERMRLEKEQAELQSFSAALSVRLVDAAFLARAPAEVVDGEKERLAAAEGRMQKIGEMLQSL